MSTARREREREKCQRRDSRKVQTQNFTQKGTRRDKTEKSPEPHLSSFKQQRLYVRALCSLPRLFQKLSRLNGCKQRAVDERDLAGKRGRGNSEKLHDGIEGPDPGLIAVNKDDSCSGALHEDTMSCAASEKEASSRDARRRQGEKGGEETRRDENQNRDRSKTGNAAHKSVSGPVSSRLPSPRLSEC